MVVETCWAALKRSLEHEAAERFKYKGRRVYSPHFAIKARINICKGKQFDDE